MDFAKDFQVDEVVPLLDTIPEWLHKENTQDDKGKAKAYQVRQVLLAIGKLKELQRER